jgi:hypothetical protein
MYIFRLFLLLSFFAELNCLFLPFYFILEISSNNEN